MSESLVQKSVEILLGAIPRISVVVPKEVEYEIYQKTEEEVMS